MQSYLIAFVVGLFYSLFFVYNKILILKVFKLGLEIACSPMVNKFGFIKYNEKLNFKE